MGAQYKIGHMYEFGLGVGQDSTEAVKWYRLAGTQGNVEAQNRLGVRIRTRGSEGL